MTMSTDIPTPTYTVKAFPVDAYGLSHAVYRDTDLGPRAGALCYSEADAQRVAEALNNYPAALAVVRKLHALNTEVHDWDEALRLDADIRRLTAKVLGLPLDSPAAEG